MRIISILAVWVLSVACAAAQEEALPDSVITPYMAHEAAVQAGDLERAADTADQAWRAGERARIDIATLEVLAENAGVYAYRSGRYEVAAEAFLRAAELNRSGQTDPLVLARAYRSASDAQLRIGETRQAFISAERAVEALEGLPEMREREAETALALANMSTSRWIQNQYRRAGRYGEQAVQAARRAGIVELPIFGVAAFQAGAYYAYEERPLESSYWFAVATVLLSDVEEGMGANLREAAGAWGGSQRSELNPEGRASLMERLRLDNVYSEQDQLSAERQEPTVPEGWVDAVPVTRIPPRYPEGAAYAGAEGFALARFDVDAEGEPINIEIVYSIPYREFGEEAERAVRRWRYEPATQDGVPVIRRGIVTRLDFELAD